MLNTNVDVNQKSTTKVNAVSGHILKSHPLSFFQRFHLKSKMAENILGDDPTYRSKRGNTLSYASEHAVVILQMLVCGDMEVLAEIMFKDDYDNANKED